MYKKLTEYNLDDFSLMAYFRICNGLTQTQLAKLCGCSRTTISSIENGTEPSLYLAFKIARELGSDVYTLFDRCGVYRPDYEIQGFAIYDDDCF